MAQFGVIILSDPVSTTSWSLQRPPNSLFLFKYCDLEFTSTVSLNNREKRSEFWKREIKDEHYSYWLLYRGVLTENKKL